MHHSTAVNIKNEAEAEAKELSLNKTHIAASLELMNRQLLQRHSSGRRPRSLTEMGTRISAHPADHCTGLIGPIAAK